VQFLGGSACQDYRLGLLGVTGTTMGARPAAHLCLPPIVVFTLVKAAPCGPGGLFMLTALFIIGITAEAMTGALAAGRQKMDMFGVVMVACVTALGGGSVRDMLLGHYPLIWVAHPHYLVIVTIAAIVTVLTSPLMKYFRVLFLVLDSVGLAVFTVFGIRIALEMGYGFVVALVSGLLTGVMGGILRDLLCNRIPLVFHKELYASVVPLGVIVYLGFDELGIAEDITVITSLLTVFITRIIAIYFKLSLPVFDYQESQPARREWNKIWHFPRRTSARFAYGFTRHLKRSSWSSANSADTPGTPPSADTPDSSGDVR